MYFSKDTSISSLYLYTVPLHQIMLLEEVKSVYSCRRKSRNYLGSEKTTVGIIFVKSSPRKWEGTPISKSTIFFVDIYVEFVFARMHGSTSSILGMFSLM